MTRDTLIPVSNEAADASEPSAESFSQMLAEFEQSHSRKSDAGARQIEGTVISLDDDSVYVDIGYKTEGIFARTAFPKNAESIAPGQKLPVSVKGRNAEGYYELSLVRVEQPKDWQSLQQAFEQNSAIPGTVTSVVKGGLTVDVGVRAFMPSSRSGVRDAAEMEKLVGQDITCRIIKLDTTTEDVVVDRRVILEEQAAQAQQGRLGELHVGDIVSGTVRSLTTYGAFIDLGGIEGLLHIGDIAWSRVTAPEDVLSVGQTLEVKVLSVDPDAKRLSLGLKQMQAEPWQTATERYTAGQRINGTVTRLMDFGAFVEFEPGIEGLIHVSEMSWVKKVHKPSDILKSGDRVEAVILSINPDERRIALGLKQTLGDPWADVSSKFPVGSSVEGTVVRMMKFGAFVQIEEGVDGLIHISEITADRHLHHPQDVLRIGESVKAKVLAVDTEKRQLRLSIKQLAPTSLAEYFEDHKEGDIISGRVIELTPGVATVELGEGIRAHCDVATSPETVPASGAPQALDLSSLSSMLKAQWKGSNPSASKVAEPLSVGQVRSFKLVKLDRDAQNIRVALV
jgi:small subunit ribosomal protein S1